MKTYTLIAIAAILAGLLAGCGGLMGHVDGNDSATITTTTINHGRIVPMVENPVTSELEELEQGSDDVYTCPINTEVLIATSGNYNRVVVTDPLGNSYPLINPIILDEMGTYAFRGMWGPNSDPPVYVRTTAGLSRLAISVAPHPATGTIWYLLVDVRNQVSNTVAKGVMIQTVKDTSVPGRYTFTVCDDQGDSAETSFTLPSNQWLDSVTVQYQTGGSWSTPGALVSVPDRLALGDISGNVVARAQYVVTPNQ